MTVRARTLPFLIAFAALAADGAMVRAQAAEEPDWELDLEAARRLWGNEPPLDSVHDLHRLRVDLENRSLWVGPQLFDVPLAIVPYADHDDLNDASGRPVARGDQELARRLAPGEIGLAIRHQRPKNRTLDVGAAARQLLPEVGLRYTHLEVLVGVVRDGERGVVSLNSPPAYAGGRFGGPDYPMIFYRLDFSAFGEREPEVLRSLRAWLVAFGSLLTFPVQYQGQDPLAASTPQRVTEHARRAVEAIAGDEESRQWFREKENQLYCSEYALLAINAAVQHPLHAEEMTPLVGEKVWRRFTREVERFDAGLSSGFTLPRLNRLAALVDIRPSENIPLKGEERELAIVPMTLVDMVERSVVALIPPTEIDPAAAEARAALLGTLAVQARTRVSIEDEEELRQLDELLQRLLALELRAVGEYRPERHREELRPLLDEIESLLCAPPRSQSCLYAPPALFPWIAQGDWPAHGVRVEYLGHGIHYSLVRSGADSTTQSTRASTPEEVIACNPN